MDYLVIRQMMERYAGLVFLVGGICIRGESNVMATDMKTACVAGACAQSSSEAKVGIILGGLGGTILVVLTILLVCLLCRPKNKDKKKPPSRLGSQNGSGPPRSKPVATVSPVPPGVWTTNPVMFSGVPNAAYSFANGQPPTDYSSGVNGRIYTSQPDLREIDRRKRRPPPPPVQSQPNLGPNSDRGKLELISTSFPIPEENEYKIKNDRPNKTVIEVRDPSLPANGVAGDQRKSTTARAYSNYVSQPDLNRQESYNDNKAYVAKVYSGYSEPSTQETFISDETGENIARVYSTFDRPQQRSQDYVASALVRSHESSLNVGHAPSRVFMPHSDWDISNRGKGVARTQSNAEKTRAHLQSKGLLQSHGLARTNTLDGGYNPQSPNTPGNLLGHKGPYGRGVVLNRSFSDAKVYSQRQVPNKGSKGSKDSKKGKEERRSGYAMMAKAHVLPRSGKITPPTSPIARGRNTEPAPHARPVTGHVQPRPQPSAQVHRSFSDAEALRSRRPVVPQQSAPNDPDVLYAVPSKLLRHSGVPEATTGHQHHPRQISPSVHSPPPPPPPPPAPTTATTRPFQSEVIYQMLDSDEPAPSPKVQPKLSDTSGAQDMRARNMSVSSESDSVGYARAGVHVTCIAFDFLDNYSIKEAGAASCTAPERTTTPLSQIADPAGYHMTSELFGFLDTYEVGEVNDTTAILHVHSSGSEGSDTIIDAPISYSATQGNDGELGRVATEAFKFLDDFDEEGTNTRF